MILTCPECATRYFVEDAAVGAGRTVRCTACAAAWRAEAPLDLKHAPDETAAPKPAPGPLRGEDLPKVYRARAEERKRVREAAATGAMWAGAGALLALVVAASLIFRADVVRAWPKSASAYAAIGLPVNQVGLTIEQVQAQPALQDGRAALVVSGVLRNIRSKPVIPPRLDIALLDKAGTRVKQANAATGEAPVPPAATRAFTLTVLEPPAIAAEVEVSFAPRRQSAEPTQRAVRREAAQLKLRERTPRAPSATPVEAKPLPADNVYALPATG